jgi:hypothetical protein
MAISSFFGEKPHGGDQDLREDKYEGQLGDSGAEIGIGELRATQ